MSHDNNTAYKPQSTEFTEFSYATKEVCAALKKQNTAERKQLNKEGHEHYTSLGAGTATEITANAFATLNKLTSNGIENEKAKQQIKTLIKKENQEKEERDKKPLGSILKKSIKFGASSGCMLGGMLSMLDVYGVVTKKGLTKTTMMREISRAISFNIIYMAGYC